MCRILRFTGLVAMCAAASFVLPGPPAHSKQVRLDFQATVVDVDDPADLFASAFLVGDLVTGYYRFDSSQPDSRAYDPQWGTYRFTSRPFGIRVQTGTGIFRTDPENTDFLVEIGDDVGSPPADLYTIVSYNNLAVPSLPASALVEYIYWNLTDPAAAVLSTDSLVADPPHLCAWSENQLTIAAIRPGEATAEGFTYMRVVGITFATQQSTEMVGTMDSGGSTTPVLSLSPPQINYEVPVAGSGDPLKCRLAIYDVRGRCVRTLANGTRLTGKHSAIWDQRDDRGRMVASGVYFVHLDAGTAAATRRLVVVR